MRLPMNISVCITVLNEEGSIGKLLASLAQQTKKADEIIVVDGGSQDKTVEIIKHYQKKDRSIKLLKEKCSRARGRNLAVEMARNEVIAMTDAGCVARRDWLEKITEPLFHLGGAKAYPRGVCMDSSEAEVRNTPRGCTGGVDVVAGFYKMVAKNSMQEAMKAFLGILPQKFDVDFLPSTRSVAFRKFIWEEVGGFEEKQKNTAEDTFFNYKFLKMNKKISRVKDAIVEWGMPGSIYEVGRKIYEYARGDAKTKIFFFPGKGLASHNIKAIFVILRYLLGLILLILGISQPVLLVILVILFLLYLFRAFRKAGLWGIILQIISDIAVMSGFASGLLE